MKVRTLLLVTFCVLGLALIPSYGEGPIIPPSASNISPAGMERGSTVTFTIEGRNLSDATEVIFDAPGLSGRVTQIADVPEQITGPRAGEDLEAQVPLGKKQTAKLEITSAKEVLPGIHRFRVKSPLGTTNMIAFAVGMLPEIKKHEKKPMDAGAPSQLVELPATLIGAITLPGDKDTYQFDGKAGEEVVFRVQASPLGSKLESLLVLSDDAGKMLAAAGQNMNSPDAELSYKLAQDGRYSLSISDRDQSGGMEYFYRLDAGPLPYITGMFPLGARAGHASEISVTGVNLGSIGEVKVEPAATDEGWATVPLEVIGGRIRPLNRVRLEVGNEPEVHELEPNDTIVQAQTISLPITINGHIDGGKSGGSPDEDYFRFRASKGERLDIDVSAARLGSALDPVIEVLDAQGNAIPRATIRCLNQTTTTLSDRDSRTTGIRLNSTSELHEGDYLMVGDELTQVDFVPDQPDADTSLKGMNDLRLAYLGTSPNVHAINTPVYKAQILPPMAEFPSNGLPVFHLNWRNDDGGPGYGADSKLDFVAPTDGEYLLHLKDVRGMEGLDFAYRLTIRSATPDFQLKAEPANPNIPKGGSTLVTVSVVAIRDYEGPIEVEVKGLPHGASASPATILPGQDSTVVVLSAAPDAPLNAHPTPIEIVGHAKIDGRELVRKANTDADSEQQLQLASITPPPDVVVTTESRQVSLEPGKEATVTLHVDRHNGFKGRVPCSIENLPPGVRVVNVGLNGVLVTEAQTSRTFTLRAEDWAKPVDQPIYVVGKVESNSPTMHPSAPIVLKVDANKQTANANLDQKDNDKQSEIPNHASPR